MSFAIAMSIFAGAGLLLIVGALLADIREWREWCKAKLELEELIAEIRADTERVKQANYWRKKS